MRRILILLLLAGCTPAAPPPTKAVESAAWSAFVTEFVEATFRAQPFAAVQAGRHEFDGQMGDWSAAGMAAEVARLNSARVAALAIDSSDMSHAQRFERDYLVSEMDRDLFWLSKAQTPFRNPAWYVERMDPEVYLSRPYAPLKTRMAGYIGYARAIPGIAANIRANLRTPLPKTFVEYAVKAFGGFADFYAQDVPKVFASVDDVAAQKELASANAAASRAMRELRDWFKAQRKSATNDFALGPELFAAMVRDTEGVTVPLADIEAAGRADLARNTAALKEACQQFAPGKSLPDCVAKVSARKPSGGAVAGARAQLASLKSFIEAKGIVSIPGTEEAQVAESPPYNRSNSAYINIPGFYEKNVPSVFNITPPDPAWTPKQQAEYIDGVAESLNTSVHEVWPGHFLQFLHSNRCPSIVGRLWVGYGFAEGWAHYAEQLMWDMGLGNGDPEIHIAQLTDALWRDVRLIAAIGLHTQGMTVAEAQRMFREQALNDVGNAQQSAARGTYDPAYLNYTLGKLEIIKLRDDWVAKRLAGRSGVDPKSEWRAFHDQFLSYGGPQIPLVRREMMGEDGALL